MNKYRFSFLDKFKRDYKDAKKKNPKLDEEFEDFLELFEHTAGDFVVGASGAQKIRVARGACGKSGGYRVYYYYAVENKIYLLRLYAKNEINDISIKEKIEISEIIKSIKANY